MPSSTTTELEFSEKSINEKLARLAKCKDLKTVGFLVEAIQSEFKLYTSLVKLNEPVGGGESDQESLILPPLSEAIQMEQVVSNTIEKQNASPKAIAKSIEVPEKGLPIVPGNTSRSVASSQKSIHVSEPERETDCIIEASVLHELSRNPTSLSAVQSSPMNRIEKRAGKRSSLKFWK